MACYFRADEGVRTVKDDEMIICRCEEVTLRELREAIAKGTATPRQLKLETRAGMGFCQGRTCRPLVERLTGESFHLQDASSMTCRPPARPVTFGRLAGEERK